jgi:HAD superfamily hydrolase (TIGR01490 family)
MSSTANHGSRIAAVFDIDGTLLPAPSLELRLLADLALARKLRLRAIGTWVRILATQILRTSRASLKNRTSSLALDENKAYWQGVETRFVDEWIAREFSELEFFSEALEILDWHRRRGHAIVLMSGTLAPLARALGSLLAGDAKIFVRATELECKGGRWSGRVDGKAICGPAKERELKQMAAENNFDLSQSYAYADSWKDRWLLGAVGHPIAVNAGPKLAQLARKSGWRLLNWNGRSYMRAIRNRAEFSSVENDGQALAEKIVWK